MGKYLCFIVYTTASPEEPPSVTSGLRVSVQSTKPSSPIRLLYEQLPKVYVFSAHKICKTFVLLFLIDISFQDPGYPWGLCALFIADTNPRELCVSGSLEVGNTFQVTAGYALCSMFFFSLLDVSWEVLKVLGFPHMFGLMPVGL